MPPEDNLDELVEIEIGGETFMVPKAQALAMQAQHDQITSANELAQKSMSEQIETLSKKVDGIEIPPVANVIKDDDNIDFDFLTSPEKILDEREAKLKKEVKDELRTEYEQKQAEEKFWDDFYSKNKDLKGSKIFVLAIFNRDYNKFKDMKIEETHDALAEDTRKELLKSMPGKAPSTTEVPVLEGGGAVVASPFDQPAESAQPKVVPMSQQLKNRRTQRRNARLGKK